MAIKSFVAFQPNRICRRPINVTVAIQTALNSFLGLYFFSCARTFAADNIKGKIVKLYLLVFIIDFVCPQKFF
jgi:hypothetical protein